MELVATRWVQLSGDAVLVDAEAVPEDPVRAEKDQFESGFINFSHSPIKPSAIGN